MTPLDELLNRLRDALTARTFVKLTLGAHRGADESLRNVFLRPVTLREGDRLQFVYRHATRDVTKNLPLADAIPLIARLLTTDFASAHLFTTEFSADWKRGANKLKLGPPRHSRPPDTAHDRGKHRLINPRAPWLQALRATADKIRQVDKFTEILSGLVTRRDSLRVVDMGCGKGYLTFAAYELLGGDVRGIEARAELVAQSNRIAQEHHFTGLRFETGRIAETTLDAVDVLIALHACDTATDDALAQGIRAGAEVMLVAPCCHKELRPQLHVLPALRHGILLQRQAELVTDALRAALLEWAGYETKVFEFISTEHTAKNLMLTAVKRGRAGTATAARELAAAHGIKHQRLAQHLGFELGPA